MSPELRLIAQDMRLTTRAACVSRVTELVDPLRGCAWFVSVLGVANRVDPPDWWISAGVIRDIIWYGRFGSRFDPAAVKDIDLGFFDPDNLSPSRDHDVEAALRALDSSLVWDAKNQAAVHLWYPRRFGIEVDPFSSASEAVATFPEYCTCVGVRWSPRAGWDVAAPYGLDDLLDGVWRRNPIRVTTGSTSRGSNGNSRCASGLAFESSELAVNACCSDDAWVHWRMLA